MSRRTVSELRPSASAPPSARRRRTAAVFGLLLAVLVGAAAAQAPSLPDTIKDIEADPETGALYVLSPKHQLWGLEPAASPAFRLLGQLSHVSDLQELAAARIEVGQASPRRARELGYLEPIAGRTAFCPVHLAGRLWIAGIGSRPLSGGATWQITSELAPAEDFEPPASWRGVARMTRFGRLLDVAFDPPRQRLLLTDPDREGIYEIKLSDDGLGELVLAVSGRLVRSVGRLAILSDRLFVTEEDRQAVLRIDLVSEQVVTLIDDLPSLEFLAVHPGGSRLIVGGVAPRDGLRQIDLATSAVEVLDTGESRLGRIVGIAVDTRDHLWIAGQDGRTLFEFGPGASPRLEGRWEWHKRQRRR